MKLKIALLSLIIASCLLLIPLAHAQTPPIDRNLQTAQQQLTILQKRIDLAHKKLAALHKDNSLSLTGDLKTTQKQLNVTKLHLAITKSALKNDEIEIFTIQQSLVDTQNALTTIKSAIDTAASQSHSTKSALQQDITPLQEQFVTKKTLLKLQKHQLTQVTKVHSIHQSMLNELKIALARLSEHAQAQRLQSQKRALNKLENRLQQQQKLWLETVEKTNHQLESSPDRVSLELERFIAQEENNYLENQIVIARIQNRLQALSLAHQETLPLHNSSAQSAQAKQLTLSITDLKAQLRKQQSAMENQLLIAKQAHQQNLLGTIDFFKMQHTLKQLTTHFLTQQQLLTKLNKQTITLQSQYKEHLHHQLALRQGLPGLSLTAWSQLTVNSSLIPKLLLQTALAFKNQLTYTLSNLSFALAVSLLISSAVFVVLLYLSYVWLSQKARQSKNLPLLLLQRHYVELGILLGSNGLLLLLDLPLHAFSILAYGSLIWLLFRPLMSLARLSLFETVSDHQGRDVKLYRSLRATLIIGGILSFLTMAVHQLPVTYDVRDFCNRLFMGFLFVIGFVLLRRWRVVPDLVRPYLENRRPYVLRIVYLLHFLLPVTLLGTAVIGLLGYIELAWSISQHALVFLCVLTAYLLTRGIFMDGLGWCSTVLIRRVPNGWLWTQAVLKPLDKVIKLMLLFASALLLCHLFGWNKETALIATLQHLLQTPFFTFAHSKITPLGIGEFTVMTLVLVWMAKWAREFCYRWLYARSPDLGIRNSLSLFTQYAIVLIGFFSILQVVGIDLTGLTLIAGGLSVGIGIGMQDLAKNLVCGMMLLIERPVRKGDIVSIGAYEGEVTHIGLRSMNITTWDHTEVVVPNSETYSKAFTNWTRQDGIVRTVIRITINREDDPHKIRSVILHVLEHIEVIVEDPHPQVYLKEIDDTLIELEVRYFINLSLGKSRPEVRSLVLFAIWDRFKTLGIKPPHPRQDIFIQENKEPILPNFFRFDKPSKV